jgi:hypothetical protein
MTAAMRPCGGAGHVVDLGHGVLPGTDPDLLRRVGGPGRRGRKTLARSGVEVPAA